MLTGGFYQPDVSPCRLRPRGSNTYRSLQETLAEGGRLLPLSVPPARLPYLDPHRPGQAEALLVGVDVHRVGLVPQQPHVSLGESLKELGIYQIVTSTAVIQSKGCVNPTSGDLLTDVI